MIIYPPELKPGDTISMIAPSGKVNPEYVSGAKQVLEQWGLTVRETRSLHGAFGRFSATDDTRLNDLQNNLDDPEIKAVFCARGGYGIVRILDRISLRRLKKHPKWIIGYSDITALHALLSKNRICSLHAPMSSHLATEGMDEATQSMKQILFGKKQSYTIKPHPLNRTGTCTGTTRGGNLSVLYGLRGTPYDLQTENTILFIEDLNEQAYHIERMLYNLKLGGVLKKLSGLIVGKFAGCEDDPLMHRSIYESIRSLVEAYDYPVCFDFPVGHVKENVALIESGKAILEVNDKHTKLEYI